MSDDIRKGQDSSDAHEESTKPQTDASGADLSRRKIAKAGLIGAPVLMSLTSRPALGGVWCTPSAVGSGAHASHQPQRISCGGFSPGAWKNDNGGGGDDADGIKTTIRFQSSTTFTGLWEDNTPVAWTVNPTLQEVLDMGGNDDHHEFATHAVAAYLNAYYQTQTGYSMTTADVIGMVNDILLYGSFTPPGASYSWDAEQVVDFIQQTFA